MDIKLRQHDEPIRLDDGYALDLADRLEVILTLKDLNEEPSLYAL